MRAVAGRKLMVPPRTGRNAFEDRDAWFAAPRTQRGAQSKLSEMLGDTRAARQSPQAVHPLSENKATNCLGRGQAEENVLDFGCRDRVESLTILLRRTALWR